VRFGNVLGSAGSVLPIFQGQLENGEAITVTHPEMSRYFMTIQEAGWLILDAAAIGCPGDLFVLDMGEPVKIIDMVKDLIRLSGREAGSVPIRFTGLRPGEKLHETLFYKNEKIERTEVDKIIRVQDAPAPTDIEDRARKLLALAYGDRDRELRTLLFESVASALPLDGTAVAAPAVDGQAGIPATAGTTALAAPARAKPSDAARPPATLRDAVQGRVRPDPDRFEASSVQLGLSMDQGGDDGRGRAAVERQEAARRQLELHARQTDEPRVHDDGGADRMVDAEVPR
jgi:hypothetical protein